MSDVVDGNQIIRQEISSEELNRMSAEYTSMIINHMKKLPLISLKKKDFILPLKERHQ